MRAGLTLVMPAHLTGQRSELNLPSLKEGASEVKPLVEGGLAF
jgi:hypothetical protein